MRQFLLVVLSVVFLCPFSAHSNTSDISALFSMDMKSLANVKVTSVSKKEENAAHAAAAIYVITQEDIRRSTATVLPELLRGVPGVQVTRTSTNKWRISVRGFNEAFTNKLLVLIDGRSVYTPLFSGVYWDTQNPPLEDIARIEIIRGSGGSLWGANAVSGIINVITKSAMHTQGDTVSASLGTEEVGGRIFGRHGGKFGENGYYRVYAQHFAKGENQTPSGAGLNNEWFMSQAGFRTDVEKSQFSKWTIQGDIYNGVKSGNYFLPTPTGVFAGSPDEDLTGGNILGRLTHVHDEGQQSILAGYVDFTKRNQIGFEQEILTADIDYQYAWDVGNRHSLLAGGGYRLIHDNLAPDTHIYFFEESRDVHIFSGFIQDKITLLPEELFLTLGTKLEHNPYTKGEIQPTARLSWIIDDNNSWWFAANRSVRTPSRAGRDISLIVAGIPGGMARWEGNKNLKSEELISLETGFRSQPTNTLSIDVTAFMNWYDKLRTNEKMPIITASSFGFPAHMQLPLPFDNKGNGRLYGAEAVIGANLTNYWSVSGNYSYLLMHLTTDPDSTDTSFVTNEGKNAEHMFNFTSRLDLPHNIEVDNTLAYISELPGFKVDHFWRFDTRVAWQVSNGVELSVLGQNLLDSYHPETSASLYGKQAEIGRVVYGEVNINF